jgi:hypothetical protein
MLLSDVGYDMLDLLNNKAKNLSEEKNELLEKIEALEDSETESVNVINLLEKWTDADFEEKRAVASLLIDRIYISEDGTTEVVWNI